MAMPCGKAMGPGTWDQGPGPGIGDPGLGPGTEDQGPGPGPGGPGTWQGLGQVVFLSDQNLSFCFHD